MSSSSIGIFPGKLLHANVDRRAVVYVLKSMKKVVYNCCHGGFALSKIAAMWLAGRGHEESIKWLGHVADKGDSWKDSYYPMSLSRHSALLVECVETLGSDRAAGLFSELKVGEVEDLYRIEEYDGLETIVTPETVKQWTSALNDPEEKKSHYYLGREENT